MTGYAYDSAARIRHRAFGSPPNLGKACDEPAQPQRSTIALPERPARHLGDTDVARKPMMGAREYDSALNGSPAVLTDLDGLKINTGHCTLVKMHEGAPTTDSYRRPTRFARR